MFSDLGIKEDLHRYLGKGGIKLGFQLYRTVPGFQYLFWFRLSSFFYRKKYSFLLKISGRILRSKSWKFGISIPYQTQVGKGFYIGHFTGIFVNRDTVIGNNVNISQGVTIGQVNRGLKKGVPSIGNNVYIGPGVTILGKIIIGNNVAIGANSVVTKDVPDNAVIVGIPGRILSMEGSDGYVNRCV